MSDREHSHPWEPATVPLSDAAEALVKEAVEAQFQARVQRLACEGKKARRSKGAKLDKETATVGALVLDVLSHHLSGYEDPLVIRLDKNWLSHGPKDLLARNRTVNERLKDLVECGWLIRQDVELKGRWATSLGPGVDLLDAAKRWGLSLEHIGVQSVAPEIELKGKYVSEDDRRRPILPVEASEDTERLLEQLGYLNDFVSKARLEGLPNAQGVSIGTKKRRLMRSFLDGSFDRGGRLGGPAFWLNLSREHRRSSLRIDGEPIAEVDIQAMLPSIAYGISGDVPDGDPYTLEDYPDIPRDALKKAMLQLMWSHITPKSRLSEAAREAIPSEYKAGQVFQLIRERNAPIAHLLGCPEPVGASLMHHESEIIIAASLRCFEEGFTALPLHDALLTACGPAMRAKEILKEAFEDRLGVQPEVKVDLFNQPMREA